jgi:excisionase family DNA binding protein
MDISTMDKLLYRPDEVAKILSFSERKIRQWVEEGILEAHCVNGVKTKPLRITRVSIKAFYDSGIVQPEDWLE